MVDLSPVEPGSRVSSSPRSGPPKTDKDTPHDESPLRWPVGSENDDAPAPVRFGVDVAVGVDRLWRVRPERGARARGTRGGPGGGDPAASAPASARHGAVADHRSPAAHGAARGATLRDLGAAELGARAAGEIKLGRIP